MKKLVGNYMLGFRIVRLYVNPDSSDGSVELLPNDTGLPVIVVGIDCPVSESTGILLHEAYEAALIDLNTRYKKNPSLSGESSDYIFLMSHNELGEAHERVGIFLVDAYPDFVKAYAKYKKK